MSILKLLKGRKSLLCLFIIGTLSLTSMPAFASSIVLKNPKEINKQNGVNISFPNKPISSYWYPDQLLNWNFENDSNVQFNKSSVPLAHRTDKEKLKPVNKTQNKDVNVVAISIMNANTSGNSPQGTNKFSSNTFSYWQYIDKLVYWGGSAGEGIIVPPSPEVTDSAHRNGVPVLGTIFFPMMEHGGKVEWLDKFLEKDSNGEFPMVDKLIEVANLYGFDGWFINQETDGNDNTPLTKKHAELMQEFIKNLKNKTGDKLEIMWYDSMTKDGVVDWQNALTNENECFIIDGNNKVADDMFLNFWWTNDSLANEDLLNQSRNKAKQLGLNPYNLYAGIDVQSNGYNTPIKWDLFSGNGKEPYTSLGLYCPSWTYFSSNNVKEFQAKENRLWVNELGNPSLKTSATKDEWRGISTYSIEKTVVNTLPFITNFNMGNGTSFYINGIKSSNKEWSNRSLGDIMPTYRWIIDNNKLSKLSADIDYSTAYYGGNSIKLSGRLSENESPTIKLYSADLNIPENIKFSTVAKSNELANLNLDLEFSDGSKAIIEGDKPLGKGWTTVNYDLSKYIGKTIRSISYSIVGNKDIRNFSLNIGNIVINNEESSIINVNDAKVDEVNFSDGIYASAKLSWSPQDKAHHYEIYRVNADNTKELIGATPNNVFYIDGLKRNGMEDNTRIQVLAVNNNCENGTGGVLSINWPSYPIPNAEFKVSKTLVSPNEKIEITNKSSEVTNEIEWNVPGANIISNDSGNITVEYEKEGIYPVTMIAKNASGEDVETKEELITVTSNASSGLKNLSQDKFAVASGFTNENEAPKFALDNDDSTKWCATGDGPHSITIDLGDIKEISQIKIEHAGAGGESEAMNTKAYRVECSVDGENFNQVLKVTDNNENVSDDAFKVTKARYVRVIIDEATQGADAAARIYGIQVFGIDL